MTSDTAAPISAGRVRPRHDIDIAAEKAAERRSDPEHHEEIAIELAEIALARNTGSRERRSGRSRCRGRDPAGSPRPPAPAPSPWPAARTRRSAREEHSGDIGREDAVDEKAREEAPAHRRQPEYAEDRGRRRRRHPTIGQQRHDVADGAVDRHRDQEKRGGDAPEAEGRQGLAPGQAGRLGLGRASRRSPSPGCGSRMNNATAGNATATVNSRQDAVSPAPADRSIRCARAAARRKRRSRLPTSRCRARGRAAGRTRPRSPWHRRSASGSRSTSRRG